MECVGTKAGSVHERRLHGLLPALRVVAHALRDDFERTRLATDHHLAAPSGQGLIQTRFVMDRLFEKVHPPQIRERQYGSDHNRLAVGAALHGDAEAAPFGVPHKTVVWAVVHSEEHRDRR